MITDIVDMIQSISVERQFIFSFFDDFQHAKKTMLFARAMRGFDVNTVLLFRFGHWHNVFFTECNCRCEEQNKKNDKVKNGKNCVSL